MSRGNSAPNTAEAKRALAFFRALSPSLYRLWRVTAAAVPEGNLSLSWLMRFLFIGMARTVPNTARKKVHATRTGTGRCSPCGLASVADSMTSAAMAETIVPPVA